MPNAQTLEIIILAVVAGVILFRLYTVLGRRTGHEGSPEDYRYQLFGRTTPDAAARPVEPAAGDKVQALPGRTEPVADKLADPVANGLAEIKQADRAFDAENFVAGARGAYEMIVTAFAHGERATLKPLLSSEVYAAFDQVITAREKRQEKVEFTFVAFKTVKPVHAGLKNRTAEVTLSIGAQFISATTAADGQLLEGDTKTVRDVTDVWTFARDVKARDPNWLLVATSGHDA